MKTLTLQEAKDQIARESTYKDWADFISIEGHDPSTTEYYWRQAALLHSLSCQEALREKIASKPDVIVDGGKIKAVDVNSIRNTPLIEG